MPTRTSEYLRFETKLRWTFSNSEKGLMATVSSASLRESLPLTRLARWPAKYATTSRPLFGDVDALIEPLPCPGRFEHGRTELFSASAARFPSVSWINASRAAGRHLYTILIRRRAIPNGSLTRFGSKPRRRLEAAMLDLVFIVIGTLLIAAMGVY